MIANGKEFIGDPKDIKTKFSSDELSNLIRCILLCHDAYIMADSITGSSQDDIVLIEAIHTSGLGRLLYKDLESTKIEVNGSIEEYTLLKKIDFTSERKMMSVIYQNKKSQGVHMFSKGADCAIADRLADKNEVSSLVSSADNLSSRGFRTLCYAMKDL